MRVHSKNTPPRAIERYVVFIVRHRLAVVIATALVTLFFGFQLHNLRLEIRRRANLPSNHPYVRIQNQISDLFGGEAVAIIGIVANQGTIYTPEILGKVWEITEGMRTLPGVIESNLFSLAAPYVKVVVAGADGAMDVHPLLREPPVDDREIARVRNDVRDDRLFRGNLVSSDETATVIVADFDAGVTDIQIAQGIDAIISPLRDSSVTIALAGAPILRKALAEYTAMIAILFPLALFVIGLIHYEAFRTLQGMLLPLITALLSVVWSLGIMGFLGLAMDTWSAMTPVLILAVAAGHAVQILKRYYEEFAQLRDAQGAVVRALSAVGPVMLTAGIIAAAGFGSLATFGVESVRVFGLLLAAGILSALALEMTFTPACRSLLPNPKIHEMEREAAQRWLDRVLENLAFVVVGRPRTLLLLAISIVAIFALGITQIHVDNSFRLWFAPSTQLRRDDTLLNQKLAGTATLRILIQGKHAGALKEPGVLQAIGDLQDFLEHEPLIGGVTSIVNHVKRMNQAMNGGDQEYYRIPNSEALVSRYLAVYELSAGPDGLSAFIDDAYTNAVVRALAKTDTAVFSRDLISRLQVFAAARFRDVEVDVGIAGGTLGVQTAMNDVVIEEKIANIAQVTMIICGLTMLVLRSVVGATFVLIPLAAAVVVNLGLMGWSGTWLDMTTAAITAMGVSIGADFAIYLIVRIREQWAKGEALEEAIRNSLLTSGKAIFFVSSAVAGGYMVLALSGFSIWMRLGVLTATIVFVSALATLTILPALVLLVEPRFIRVGGWRGDGPGNEADLRLSNLSQANEANREGITRVGERGRASRS